MQTELAGKVVRNCSLWIWTGASVASAFAIAMDLHSGRAAVLWVLAIALWAAYFWPKATEEKSFGWTPRSFSLAGFVIVSAGGALARLYRLADLPLGSFVDEIFTLNSTLLQLEQPFDQRLVAVAAQWAGQVVEQGGAGERPRVGEPAGGEVAEPVGEVDAAQLVHEPGVGAGEQLFGQ